MTGVGIQLPALTESDGAPLAASLVGLSKAFVDPAGHGVHRVLDAFSLAVRPGECVVLIGPSGCGKTTILRLAAGLLVPDSGSVRLFGVSPEEARRRKAIGIMFQAPNLLPWRSALENVRLPLAVNRGGSAPPDRSAELLGRVGLTGFEDYYPHQLSGGMQQRVALARTLVTDPPLLLLDEPFSALDELTRATLQADFLRLREDHAAATLLVTHSIDEAVRLGDRVVVLSGRSAQILADMPIGLTRPERTDPSVLDQVLVREHIAELRRLLRREVSE